ncbi:hypothetical protein MTR67_001870 [Solanum verrucosum]|uniref:Uncharacterized protein n=1 Tax=Solanum verrucosum TaxID=315347 RepID=A0AAF0TCS5_SOLVR|nr:hypothetical protein MTR67_001870 [Solanum verrucosum]
MLAKVPISEVVLRIPSTLPAPVDDMEWKCLLQSSLGPNMHIKPKVGAAGDIIYFIYSLLLKSGLLTAACTRCMIKKIKIPRIYHVGVEFQILVASFIVTAYVAAAMHMGETVLL